MISLVQNWQALYAVDGVFSENCCSWHKQPDTHVGWLIDLSTKAVYFVLHSVFPVPRIHVFTSFTLTPYMWHNPLLHLCYPFHKDSSFLFVKVIIATHLLLVVVAAYMPSNLGTHHSWKNTDIETRGMINLARLVLNLKVPWKNNDVCLIFIYLFVFFFFVLLACITGLY